MIRFNQAIAIGATLGILALAGCSSPQQSATTESASPSAMAASPETKASAEASPNAMASASPSAASSAASSATSSMPKVGGFADLTAVVASTTAAVTAGDFTKAQAEIAKFEEPWSKVEKDVKAKSADTYNAIEESVDKVKSALKASDKDKAMAALKALGDSVSTAAK